MWTIFFHVKECLSLLLHVKRKNKIYHCKKSSMKCLKLKSHLHPFFYYIFFWYTPDKKEVVFAKWHITLTSKNFKDILVRYADRLIVPLFGGIVSSAQGDHLVSIPSVPSSPCLHVLISSDLCYLPGWSKCRRRAAQRHLHLCYLSCTNSGGPTAGEFLSAKFSWDKMPFISV